MLIIFVLEMHMPPSQKHRHAPPVSNIYRSISAKVSILQPLRGSVIVFCRCQGLGAAGAKGRRVGSLSEAMDDYWDLQKITPGMCLLALPPPVASYLWTTAFLPQQMHEVLGL